MESMTTHINTPAVNVSSYKIYVAWRCFKTNIGKKYIICRNKKTIDQSIKSDIGMINSDESSMGVGK